MLISLPVVSLSCYSHQAAEQARPSHRKVGRLKRTCHDTAGLKGHNKQAPRTQSLIKDKDYRAYASTVCTDGLTSQKRLVLTPAPGTSTAWPGRDRAEMMVPERHLPKGRPLTHARLRLDDVNRNWTPMSSRFPSPVFLSCLAARPPDCIVGGSSALSGVCRSTAQQVGSSPTTTKDAA